jgi:hypothetical protein
LGTCKYCGKPAGLLRSAHAACEEQNQRRERVAQGGRQRIALEVLRALKGNANFDALEKTVEDIERSSFLSPAERKMLLVKGWESSVEGFLEDGILDPTEEHRLIDFKERFSLTQDELDKNGSLTKIAKAAVLRDVSNGVVPQRMSVDASLPINFQKGEQIVWVFARSDYLEDKTRRHYVGGSQGISVRVAKGFYFRTSAFKGRSVEQTERVHIDTGLVVVTDRNIYFAGAKKSVRIPYAKIVSFEPFSNGIGIMRDAASAKAQIFVTGDGWFTYNLVTNLSRK